MKKFGTRLISAVLAGCMMTSVLPVSAFALEGSAEFERTVSAQEIPMRLQSPPERWQRPAP